MEPVAAAMILGPLGTTEIIIIVLVLLLLFGGKKIPELARGLGKGITEFKDGLQNPDAKRGGRSGEPAPRIESGESTESTRDSSSEKP
jgi:sec-independent protein translocase protein TatA